MKTNTATKAAVKNVNMQNIETATALYARARGDLSATVAGLNDEIESVKKKYLPRIRKEVAVAKERRAALEAMIAAHPDLFEKPRTVIFHGVRVGFRKGEGRVTFENPDKVVELIEKHLADQADILIITERRPNKDAIAQLPAADVKRIACQITGTEDVIVVKDTAGEVDKLVAALLKDEEEAA